MLKPIDRYFVGGRTMDIVNDVYSKNQAFRKFNPQIIEILHEIRNLLPGDKKELLEDLENNKNLRGKVLYEELYRQGLVDGLRLSNIAFFRRSRKHSKR